MKVKDQWDAVKSIPTAIKDAKQSVMLTLTIAISALFVAIIALAMAGGKRYAN